MAGVVELADTQVLGSCAFGCEGSSPSFGTKLSLLARSRFSAAIVVALRNGAKHARFARGAVAHRSSDRRRAIWRRSQGCSARATTDAREGCLLARSRLLSRRRRSSHTGGTRARFAP